MTAKSLLTIVLVFSALVGLRAQEAYPSLAADTLRYPWLNPSLNMLQFYNREAVGAFYKALAKAPEKRLSIVHLGDSHLQNDVLPGQIRQRFQEDEGDGGRGLMFAFSTAKTYSSVDYNTYHTGIWQAARSITTRPQVPLGVRGMSCRTNQAGASLRFEMKVPVPESHTILKIFCKKAPGSFDISIEIDGQAPIVLKTDSSSAESPYVWTIIPPIEKNIVLRTAKRYASQSEFEFYGMSLESSRGGGVIFHNAGVGAARSHSVLYQQHFAKQLPALEPNLVIVDFGTNDYLYYDRLEPELEGEIRQVIATIRKASPKAAILLTTAQDLYWKGKNVQSGAAFAELIHKIAADTDCGVYDWHWISGGQSTMQQWVQAKLAQKDMIHLLYAGSRLKGDLMYEAIRHTEKWLAENPDGASLILQMEQAKANQAKFQQINSPQAKANIQKNTPPKEEKASPKPETTKEEKAPAQAGADGIIRHLIEDGDTLFSLARRYGVTVEQLRQWNKLRGNLIVAGQTLLVYPKP